MDRIAVWRIDDALKTAFIILVATLSISSFVRYAFMEKKIKRIMREIGKIKGENRILKINIEDQYAFLEIINEGLEKQIEELNRRNAENKKRRIKMSLDFSRLQGLEGNVRQTDVPAQAAPIQREINKEKAERDRSLEICREYQENIKKTALLRAEINNGILQGENIYSLFLKAIDALGILVHDKSMYSRTRESLISIYGYGLGEPEPLEVELEAVEARIERMRDKIGKVDYCAEWHLERAIEKHRERSEKIRKQIEDAKARKAADSFNKAKEC